MLYNNFWIYPVCIVSLNFKKQTLLYVNIKYASVSFNYTAFISPNKFIKFHAQNSTAACYLAYGALELLQIFNKMYIM